MVAIPTNYKMGTGLAATIMGQQAGLEAEQTGLQNLYKAMQMPQQALQGQESAMLMQDPNYLQQKTANTLIELGNTYNANQIQATLNEVGRAELALQAAGGDPSALYPYLQQMGMKEGDPLWTAVQKNPQQVIERYRQGLEAVLARTGGAKQAGAMQIAEAKGENAEELARLRGDIQSKLIGQRAATGGASRPLSMTQYEAQLRIRAGQGDQQAIQELNALEDARIRRTTAGIEARNAPIMNLLGGRTGGAAPAPQAKGGVIKLD